MSDAIDRLVQEVSFPRSGELFAVFLLPFTRDGIGMFGDTTEKVTTHDRSYRGDIWKCLASDAVRVVAMRIHGGYRDEKPQIFFRPDCRFDDVSLIAPALGLPNEAEDEPS